MKTILISLCSVALSVAAITGCSTTNDGSRQGVYPDLSSSNAATNPLPTSLPAFTSQYVSTNALSLSEMMYDWERNGYFNMEPGALQAPPYDVEDLFNDADAAFEYLDGVLNWFRLFEWIDTGKHPDW